MARFNEATNTNETIDVKTGEWRSIPPNDNVRTVDDLMMHSNVTDNKTNANSKPVQHSRQNDKERLEAINRKYEMMLTMAGDVDGMVVSGTPGIGKSFGIQQSLIKRNINARFVKGGMSPVGLFVKLWETRASNFALVIDDCDGILYKTEGLALLKGALETSSVRPVHWEKQNTKLKEMGIPKNFDYSGKIIFITNLDFETVTNTRLKADLDAIRSRCFYLDMDVKSNWDKFLRTRYVVQQNIFRDKITIEEENELLEFFETHLDVFREISIRSFEKLTELYKKFPEVWQCMAENSLFQHSGGTV
jgi:hypothetical protein